MKSESEIKYTEIVTNFIKDNKTKLKLRDARKVLEETQMSQQEFVTWAWDLFRVARDPAREMYRKAKENENDNN